MAPNPVRKINVPVTKPPHRPQPVTKPAAPRRTVRPAADPTKPKGSPLMPPIQGKGAEMSARNAAGAAMHDIDPLKALDMLLRMGIIGTNLYAAIGDREEDALGVIITAIAKDPLRCVEIVKEVLGHEFEPGKFRSLALRDNLPHLVYGLLLSNADVKVRQAAAEIFNQVIHTGEDVLDMLAILWGTREDTSLAHQPQTSPTHTKRTGNLRGMGSIVQRCFRKWLGQPIGLVAYQLTKYGNRHGYSAVDLLKLARPKPASAEHELLFKWLIARDKKDFPADQLAKIEADVRAKIGGMPAAAITIKETSALLRTISSETGSDAIRVKAIKASKAVREIVPTEWYDKAVWGALLEDMPVTAMLRNLGQMSRHGVFGTAAVPDRGAIKLVVEKLTNADIVKYSRVHPLRVLIANRAYAHGSSLAASAARGRDYTWWVSSKIVEATEEAFELSFGNVPLMTKSVLFAHDVSSSMGKAGTASVSWDAARQLGIPVDSLYATEIEQQKKIGRQYGLSMLTGAELIGAVAMVMLRRSPNMVHTYFSIKGGPTSMNWTDFEDPTKRLLARSPLTASSTLGDVLKETNKAVFGATDLSLPIDWCLQEKVYPDAIVIGTDYEMNCGRQPMQAMAELRRAANKPVKFIVIATQLPRLPSSITDQFDVNCLDVAGASADVATVVQEFVQQN